MSGKSLFNNLHNLQGERKNQLLIVSDRNGKHLGTATREECHRGTGIIHLAFAAFVLDKKGRIILTKRSKQKSLWGGFWDASVVSHVLPGETVEAAAHRRGKEELAIEVDFKSIGAFHYVAQYEKGVENEYCYVLIGRSSSKVTYNPVEISEVRKVSFKELIKDVKNNPEDYTPWLRLAIKKVDLWTQKPKQF